MDKPTWRIILVKNNTNIIAVLSISRAAFFASIDLTYVYFCWKTNRTRGGKIRYFEFFGQKDRMKVFQYKAPTSLKMQSVWKPLNNISQERPKEEPGGMQIPTESVQKTRGPPIGWRVILW